MKSLLTGSVVLLSLCIQLKATAALPDVWNIRSSPSSNHLNGVFYGNGLFVAVGYSTTILTSPDGINWTARSAGMTTPTLWCGAYGNGRYVLGGGEGALLLTSTNGIHWTNVLSTIGMENIHAITFEYGQFVAVGKGGGGGPPFNSGYILTSSNGLDWTFPFVPTTNTLFDVSPPASSDGIGWADYLFVAVGDHGTIVTSSNGANWELRNSGTTVALHTVAWSGGLLAGGDSGTVLSSSDAITWTPAAPASFHIRGFASRFNDRAVVAVGSFATSGRLHASTDGLTWPGFAKEFSQPLNAVAYGGGSFVAVGNGGLILQSGPPVITNEWTKPTSGYWEEPFWSLGVLPSTSQTGVAFRNSGWKALAIGMNTTANYASSLQVNNLLVDAPLNSGNQLLLNWAGLVVPLQVRSNLMIGVNGSLASHYSVLQAADVDLRGWATFSDSAIAVLNKITLDFGGTLSMSDASLASTNLTFVEGTVFQSGGTAMISRITQELHLNPVPSVSGYYISDGVLVSGSVSLGVFDLFGRATGFFVQDGGIHTNFNLTLLGGQRHFQEIIHVGYYLQNGGLLVSDRTSIYGGTLSQSSGTNLIVQLTLAGAGDYLLSGGQLVTSNTIVYTTDCLSDVFAQSGGSHSVENLFLIGDWVRYSLSAGTLGAAIIEIIPAGELLISGGAVSNSDRVILRLGGIRVEGSAQRFGKLEVQDGFAFGCMSPAPTAARLNLGSTNVPGTLRFQDSRDVPWSGTLHIVNWSTNHSGNGPDHVFIGASSQALTADQLSRVLFIRPSGLPSDYTAVLTPAGELVPGLVHDFNYATTNGAITITEYTGSATNVVIPGVINGLPVTSIGDGAFIFESEIVSITMPNTVTNIGDFAFAFCNNLTNITIPSGVVHIGDGAFASCHMLTSITIPASVSDLGIRIFESCNSLVAITVDPANPVCSSVDGILFDKGQTRLIEFPAGKAGNYVVPATVLSIEDYAFFSCDKVTNVLMDASVTNLGTWSFGFCVNLTNIVIGSGVTTLGDFAFFDCFSLRSVVLPNSLTAIGGRAFENCSALVRVEVGRGVAVFGGGNFANCTNLAGVYFRGDAPVAVSDFYNSFPTIYYLPGTTGWGPTFAGRPTAPWFLLNPVILDFGSSFGVQSNRFGFVVSWATNGSLVIEASTNLGAGWSAISAQALTNGSFSFSDVQWTNYPRRFYRLRL